MTRIIIISDDGSHALFESRKVATITWTHNEGKSIDDAPGYKAPKIETLNISLESPTKRSYMTLQETKIIRV